MRETPAALLLLLCSIEDTIGRVEQPFAGRVVGEGDADAHTNFDRAGSRQDRRVELIEQTLGDTARIGFVDLVTKHCELVASDAGHVIGRPDCPTYPFCHLHEYLVAHAVTELVVDRLESVEVDVQDRGARVVGMFIGVEKPEEELAVSDAGQLVV